MSSRSHHSAFLDLPSCTARGTCVHFSVVFLLEADGDVMWCVGPRSVAEDVMVVCLATMSDAEKTKMTTVIWCGVSGHDVGC